MIDSFRKWRLTHKHGAELFFTGIALFVLGVSLSLYSVPSSPRGNPPLSLPAFPILEMSFPLVPLLLAFAPALMAGGWILWKHSLAPIFIAAFLLVVLGIILSVLGFIYAITFTVDGAQVYIMPYGAQAAQPIIVGMSLGFLSVIFNWIDMRARSRVVFPA